MIDVWHYPKKVDAKLRREIIAEYFGGESFKMLKTKRGQPYAKSHTAVLSFSVTHTDTDCFLAVSTRSLPVGVDAELKSRKIQAESIMKRCGSQPELKKFSKMKSKRDRNTFALRSWVLKEAVCKMFGTGVRTELFRTIDLSKALKQSGEFSLDSAQGPLQIQYKWLSHKKYWAIVVSILAL